MANIVKVNGYGEFSIPKGTLVKTFDQTHQISILKEDPNSTIFNGHRVVDSVHTRAYKSCEERTQAIVDLLKRNGAQPINPNGAVA